MTHDKPRSHDRFIFDGTYEQNLGDGNKDWKDIPSPPQIYITIKTTKQEILDFFNNGKKQCLSKYYAQHKVLKEKVDKELFIKNCIHNWNDGIGVYNCVKCGKTVKKEFLHRCATMSKRCCYIFDHLYFHWVFILDRTEMDSNVKKCEYCGKILKDPRLTMENKK